MSTPQDSTLSPLWRRYWPIVVLALLPLIPLFRAVFLGEAIGPFDQIRQMAPWNGAKPAQPWDVLQADGVLQFYVWRDLVFDAWGKGQLPFWNPYQLAGTPLLANSQSGALYPPHIVMGVMHVPTAAAMTLLAWFHLFWAGFGAYVLCKALGANKLGSFIGGASFSLSSFMIAWTGLPSVIETVAWIPWILGLAVLVYEGNPLLAILRKAQPMSSPDDAARHFADRMSDFKRYNFLTLGLGISIGMMVLAGHLQFVAYGFIALAILVVWLVTTRQDPAVLEASTTYRQSPGEAPVELTGRAKRRHDFLINPRVGSTSRVILAMLLGFCIAAPQLLAVLQYSKFSHRKTPPTADGYGKYVNGSIQPYELVKMFAPSIQGNPRQIASDQLPISTYYPAVLKLGANYAESAIGIGAFGLLLVCLLPLLAKKREPIWGVILFGAVGFLLALGTPLNALFYYGVPGWSSTGSPGRAICLFVLAASVGAGLAASRLTQLKELLTSRAPKLMIAFGGFVLAGIVCVTLMNSYELRPGLNQEIIDGLRSQAEGSALSSAAGISLLAIFAVAFAIWEQSARSKAILAAVPVLGCVAFLGTTLIQTGTPNLKVKNDLGMQRIAPINVSWDFLQAVRGVLPPNLAALNRIHSLDGYDSLMHRDTVGLLQDIDGENPAPPVNGNIMNIKPKADWKKLADAGVTEVWSLEAIPALGDANHEDNLYKYQLAGPGRASTPQGPAEIVSETPSQLKLRATGPGKLIVRDRHMPGWLAKVDGAHVDLGGSTWMEIELSGGEHQIELNYIPPGFMAGLSLGPFALLLVLMLAFSATMLARVGRKPS